VVARLPFDDEQLVDLVIDVERSVATNANDDDHTVFWLVVADQFARRGVHSARAREAALAIIDSGRDSETMARRGMSERDRAKRAQNLAELRARLVSVGETKRGPVLQRPQPFLFEAGEAFVFPTSRGDCINPYFRDKSLITGGWTHDGWGTAIIAERGRAFDFLAWYRPLVASSVERDKPALESSLARQHWRLRRPGTVTRRHVERMEIERAGVLAVDSAKLHARFPRVPSGVSDAVNDISIANRLHIPEVRHQSEPTVESVAELLA